MVVKTKFNTCEMLHKVSGLMIVVKLSVQGYTILNFITKVLYVTENHFADWTIEKKVKLSKPRHSNFFSNVGILSQIMKVENGPPTNICLRSGNLVLPEGVLCLSEWQMWYFLLRPHFNSAWVT